MTDSLRINGNVVSWGSIILKIGNDRFTGFKAISYGDSRTREKVYGMGKSQAPRGRTRGKYEVEPVTLTAFKATAEALRKKLADLGDGKSFGDTVFEIVVQYIEDNEEPRTDVLEDVVYVKTAASSEEGPDALVEELELDAMRIRWNGRTLFDESDGT